MANHSGIGPTNLSSATVRYGMYPADPATLNTTPATNFPCLFPNSPPAAQSLNAISVMFMPGGGIDKIYLNNWFFTPPTTVHFLIGRTDKLTALPTAQNSSTTHPSTIAMYDPAASNLADIQSLWVSVARSTGNVVTSDNQPPVITAATSGSMTILAGNTSQTITPLTDAGQTTFLAYCRQLATNREQAKEQ